MHVHVRDLVLIKLLQELLFVTAFNKFQNSFHCPERFPVECRKSKASTMTHYNKCTTIQIKAIRARTIHIRQLP